MAALRQLQTDPNNPNAGMAYPQSQGIPGTEPPSGTSTPGATPSPGGAASGAPPPNPSSGGFTPTGNIPGQQGPNNDPNWSFDQLNASYGGTAKNNDDLILEMLNSPESKGKDPQSIIDQFNNQKLGADSTGLSSNYGSSPALYGGNTIGLPDEVLNDNNGVWSATKRGPSTDGQNSGTTGLASDDPAALIGKNGYPLSPTDSGTVLPSVVDPNMASQSQFLNGILAQLGLFGQGLNTSGK